MTFDELFAEHSLAPEERKALVLHLATTRALNTVRALEHPVCPWCDRQVPYGCQHADEVKSCPHTKL